MRLWGEDRGNELTLRSAHRLPALGQAGYERAVNGRRSSFEWGHTKADVNLRKHDVAFELASSVFYDLGWLTVADIDHGKEE